MQNQIERAQQTAGSFEDFWMAYLRAHRKNTTRTFHYAATTLGSAGVVAGIMTANVWYTVFCLILSYGVAALGHMIFEKNRVVVHGRPVWSLACSFRMTFSALTGHLHDDMLRAVRK